MLPPIFKTLTGYPSIVATVAKRVYFIEAPESLAVGTPYIVWNTPGIEPENFLSEKPDIDLITVTISCYHKDQLEMVELTQAVRDSLEGICYMTHCDFSEKDKKTKMYVGYIVFDYYLPRN